MIHLVWEVSVLIGAVGASSVTPHTHIHIHTAGAVPMCLPMGVRHGQKFPIQEIAYIVCV